MWLFERVVRIQHDRAHCVIDTGPYRHVRHPGYLGSTVFYGAFPWISGSVLALAVGLLGIVGMVVRTSMEDRSLRAELAGCAAYAPTVPVPMGTLSVVDIEIREERPAALAAYASVPIGFEVRERFAVDAVDAGVGGLRLVVEPMVPPYWKDDDTLPGNHPTAWAQDFDMDGWGILTAYAGATRVGGAVAVCRAAGVHMLEGRRDIAVLWDVRVAPAWRGRGIGAALFRAAEAWAAARGARWLKVETQNVNVAACRFYARQGCVLGAIHRFAYPDLPDEVQLLWYKPLREPARSG